MMCGRSFVLTYGTSKHRRPSLHRLDRAYNALSTWVTFGSFEAPPERGSGDEHATAIRATVANVCDSPDAATDKAHSERTTNVIDNAKWTRLPTVFCTAPHLPG